MLNKMFIFEDKISFISMYIQAEWLIAQADVQYCLEYAFSLISKIFESMMFKEELARKKSIKTNLRGMGAINYYIKKPFIARKMKFSITKISDLFTCTKEILTEKNLFFSRPPSFKFNF